MNPPPDTKRPPIQERFHLNCGAQQTTYFALSACLNEHGHRFCILFREEGEQLQEISRLRCDGQESVHAREAAARWVEREKNSNPEWLSRHYHVPGEYPNRGGGVTGEGGSAAPVWRGQ